MPPMELVLKKNTQNNEKAGTTSTSTSWAKKVVQSEASKQKKMKTGLGGAPRHSLCRRHHTLTQTNYQSIVICNCSVPFLA